MKVDIIGVPIDLGANRRGVDMGPSAIRYAGLRRELMAMGIEYRDKGNIAVDVIEYEEPQPRRARHIDQINEVNKSLADQVKRSLEDGAFPIVLGGDHSIAVGTLYGVQSVLRNVGVLWIDAHTDFNTLETTMTGNVHGMPLAALTGIGAKEIIPFKTDDVPYIDPEKVVIIGARSIDEEEAVLLRKSGVTIFTIRDIDMYGMRSVMEEAIKLVSDGTVGYHVSFDMDVLNPSEAPGVGTPIYGGLTYREALLAADIIANDNKIRSLELVEVNPMLDKQNQTAEMAVSLICAMVGRKIIYY
ncbi:MAG TPA: arginase [Candidatus Atribacteria bacterium]|nr:arginase [Candidatus Atribacteria bacterium]HPT77573.1 arginase [Candidatus Atribacteria bacterium]